VEALHRLRLSTNLRRLDKHGGTGRLEPAVKAPMNNRQKIALLVAVANLALILLFPPHDYVSLQRGNIPTFDGFYYAFGSQPNRIVNGNFLVLEIIVVLINACIGLPRKIPRPGGNRRQRAVLAVVALNLVLVLLFPPFELFTAITKAALPTFEGFYFVFADNSRRQLVAPILYIEVALIIINGGLLWLLFKDRGPDEASAEQVKALAQRVRAAQRE